MDNVTERLQAQINILNNPVCGEKPPLIISNTQATEPGACCHLCRLRQGEILLYSRLKTQMGNRRLWNHQPQCPQLIISVSEPLVINGPKLSSLAVFFHTVGVRSLLEGKRSCTALGMQPWKVIYLDYNAQNLPARVTSVASQRSTFFQTVNKKLLFHILSGRSGPVFRLLSLEVNLFTSKQIYLRVQSHTNSSGSKPE